MSSHAQPARGRRAPAKGKAAEPPDPPGEVPADLRGWELREHVNDAGEFKLVNPSMKWETSPYATPQLAFDAARRMQKNSKQGGGAQAAPPADERFAKGSKPPPEGEKFARTRTYPVPLGVALTPEQVDAKCDELDAACSELETLERRFDAVKDQFKADIRVAEGKVQDIQKVLRRRADEREVQVEERLYDAAKLVVVVRQDTGVIIDQRPMKPEEMQRPLLKL